MRRIQLSGSVLLLLALLVGCGQTRPPATIAVDNLCRDWTHQKIKNADRLAEPTASQIEANNKSRPNWGCVYGKNESYSPASARAAARS